MSLSTPHNLFAPAKVSDMHLRHRVVLAPMTRLRVDAATAVIFPVVREYYAQRASTPGTLLISEGTLIAKKAGSYTPPAPAHGAVDSNEAGGGLHAASPGIWSDAQIAAWREVTDAVHAKGCFIYCQLFAMGRAATTPALAAPGVAFDLVSASPIPLPGETIVPRALTVAEIKEYVALFVAAAKNAVNKAGFDGVEVHAANGYLLDAFLQDTANQRTDEYGGSPENRVRLLLEIVDATAKSIGASKVGVRISPWSPYQGSARSFLSPVHRLLHDPGMLMADPVPTFTHLARALAARPHLAYLSVVEPRVSGASDVDASAENAAQSNDFLRALWAPRTLISAGGYNRASALARAEVGELVAFGRHFLANPDLPVRLEKDIPLARGDRSRYYTSTLEPEGYTSYAFAS
ncbi:FMN-linked oxidoreductase [Mycena maculata]|uniref:FMN-linked oxidoreductase n=1 Tax=Mycena maculata TaxID=230809 RepID=A0AAD7IKY6_9AGAR|nr:FMN-linked oxidoreductase [Mycena maculata]